MLRLDRVIRAFVGVLSESCYSLGSFKIVYLGSPKVSSDSL